MSYKGGPQVNCLHEHWVDRSGKPHYPCGRISLPGRLLCHKHAGMKAKRLRRRARNKVARRTRKAARR